MVFTSSALLERFRFFYLLPISFVTWFAGKKAGLINSLICAVIWTINNNGSSHNALTWNMISTLGIFCAAAIMLSRIHQLLEVKDSLSRTDPLTGVMNIRAFSGLVEYEILHLRRRGCPFSIAYLDLDNFKEVNDRYGHKKGDELLKAVVTCLAQSLRKTDVVARVGGDEFTIFLPATDSDVVQLVMQKVIDQLIETTRRNNLTTTFSMGVLRDLEFTKLPFILFSYCKRGGTAYENIDSGSKWGISRSGGLGFAFG